MLVLVSVRVTFAFGTAAPVESVTVPVRLPSTAWANAPAAHKARSANRAQTLFARLIRRTPFDRSCIRRNAQSSRSVTSGVCNYIRWRRAVKGGRYQPGRLLGGGSYGYRVTGHDLCP